MRKRFSKFITVSLLLLLIAGCVSKPEIQVHDANSKPVNALTLSCKQPFNLTHDCNKWSGLGKKIELDGIKFKIAGNEDKTITVMFSSAYWPNAEKSNRNYELMKKELLKRNFKIISVIPLNNVHKIQGYAIVTSKPSYQIWDEFLAQK